MNCGESRWCCISCVYTAMITNVLISLSAVQIYDISYNHLYVFIARHTLSYPVLVGTNLDRIFSVTNNQNQTNLNCTNRVALCFNGNVPFYNLAILLFSKIVVFRLGNLPIQKYVRYSCKPPWTLGGLTIETFPLF